MAESLIWALSPVERTSGAAPKLDIHMEKISMGHHELNRAKKAAMNIWAYLDSVGIGIDRTRIEKFADIITSCYAEIREDEARLDWLDLSKCANIGRLDCVKDEVLQVFLHRKITVREAIDAARKEQP